MARKPKKGPVEPSAPLWMVSYGDMTTLLLTFFILIVSMSSIEIIKFKRAMGSLQGDLGVLKHQPAVLREQNISQVKFRRSKEVTRQVEELKRKLGTIEGGEHVTVELTEQGIHFSLADPLLFDSGKADLKPGVGAVLDVLAEVIVDRSYEIRVEGHTDNVPIHTERFPSNWDLSAARALSVVEAFVRRGMPPWRFSAVGYGEWRPIFPNDRPEYRARNRRIEIWAAWAATSAWETSPAGVSGPEPWRGASGGSDDDGEGSGSG